MNYDQKLRDAMTEIEQVLKKHDVGGFITLHSKTHSEFKYCIDLPTWSMVRWVKDGEGVHLKLHSKSNREHTEATVGMLYSIKDLCGMGYMTMDKLAVQIEQNVKVEHIPFGKNGISNEDR